MRQHSQLSRRTIAISSLALVFTTIALGGRTAGSDSKFRAAVDESSVASELVDTFDRHIQKRFHEVIEFGMTRISIERQFVPESDEEKAAVRSFKKANLRLALYLAGRLVLQTKPSQEDFYRVFSFKRAVSNPRFVGPKTAVKDLPNRYDLWKSANEAMMAFSQGNDLYESSIGDWQIRAHPVRASSECLSCHSADLQVTYTLPTGSMMTPTGNTIAAGDPIGAMLYLYTPAN